MADLKNKKNKNALITCGREIGLLLVLRVFYFTHNLALPLDQCVKVADVAKVSYVVRCLVSPLRSQVVLFSDNYYIPHTYTLPYTHIKMSSVYV